MWKTLQKTFTYNWRFCFGNVFVTGTKYKSRCSKKDVPLTKLHAIQSYLNFLKKTTTQYKMLNQLRPKETLQYLLVVLSEVLTPMTHIHWSAMDEKIIGYLLCTCNVENTHKKVSVISENGYHVRSDQKKSSNTGHLNSLFVICWKKDFLQLSIPCGKL